MKGQVTINEQAYSIDFSQPIDISIPLWEGEKGVNCFYAPYFETSPVVAGDFIGATAQGGVVNFMNVRINPHGNGTHTECVGHIAIEPYAINQCLEEFHFPAILTSVYPTKLDNGDRVILRDQLEQALEGIELQEALVIRTMPNDDFKKQTKYSGSNPPYIHHEAMQWIVKKGIKHLLVDLPSVDREEDGGELLGHKAFWQYPEQTRKNSTISELIYVNNSVPDGLYLLNIQIASFEIDVSPSKPVLYALQPLDV
ncbi:MAG: cyclase family protein [Chitinophagales bacterium]|nr:cyclase family protein [Chitinophagales bacterium]